MFPAFRRITTKRAQDGRSVLAEDIAVEINELGLADFWSTSTTPARCHEFVAFGAQRPRLEPPPSGTIFRYFVIPPQGDVSTEEYKQAVNKMFAAMLFEATRPRWLAAGGHPRRSKRTVISFFVRRVRREKGSQQFLSYT